MAEIRSTSATDAWLEAIQMAVHSPHHEVSPLVVVLETTDGSLREDIQLREALDRALTIDDRAPIETVANTIFPNSLWNPAKSRQDLFRRYLKILPKLRRYPQNRRGLYFERLISYPGERARIGKNQLDHIANTYRKGNHRRSALQAAIFDPQADLSDARQLGFPCLQQVAFAPDADRGTLAVTGFYAMQYLFGRAYGNYLGLARLGQFMAHEMCLLLERVVCCSAVVRLEVPVRHVKEILERFQPSLPDNGAAKRMTA